MDKASNNLSIRMLYTIAILFAYIFAIQTTYAQPHGADSLKAVAQEDSTVRTHTLQDVVVEGDMMVKGDDHVSYLPTKMQINAANNGANLLFNMMIPQIDVDRLTGAIKCVDGKAIGLYIDERKATEEEIRQIRPKDVLRVEYYDHVSPKFPNDDKVLNYVLKKYDHGGYVDLRTSTRMLYTGGEYEAQASLDYKRMNVTMLAGIRRDKDKGAGTTEENTYGFSPSFVETNSPVGQLSENNTYYGALRTMYTDRKKTTAYFYCGLGWMKSPNNYENTSVTYSPNLYANASAYTTTYSKYVSPFAMAFHQIKFDEHKTLTSYAIYRYVDNTYNRNYTEGTNINIQNGAEEKGHNVNAMIHYNASFGKHTFTVWLNELYQNSEANYINSSNPHQQLIDNFMMLGPVYIYKPKDWFSFMARTGLCWQVKKIEGSGTRSELFPNMYGLALINLNEHSSLSIDGSVASATSNMAIENNTDQQINQYEIMRGNPELKVVKFRASRIHYNLAVKNLNFETFVNYEGNTDVIKSLYFKENNEKMIHTFLSDGKYHSLSYGINATARILNKSLQLKGNVSHDWQKVVGMNETSSDRINYGFSAAYFIGGFSFTGVYKSRRKYTEMTAIRYDEPYDYSLTASWGHKGLFIEVGCKNIFERSGYQSEQADFDIYKYWKKTVYDKYSRSVYINLSYNFDFGRKVEHERMEVGSGSSAIMK